MGFRAIFAATSMEMAIQNQSEIFTQRMGGPPLYSQRKSKELIQKAKHLKRTLADTYDTYDGASSSEEQERKSKRPCTLSRSKPAPRKPVPCNKPAATARPTVSPMLAARWLKHMNDAMDAVPEIDLDSKQRMLAYFEQTSHSTVRSKKLGSLRRA